VARKINFTRREHPALVEMLLLADWVIRSPKVKTAFFEVPFTRNRAYAPDRRCMRPAAWGRGLRGG